jgi:hypothetical protein
LFFYFHSDPEVSGEESVSFCTSEVDSSFLGMTGKWSKRLERKAGLAEDSSWTIALPKLNLDFSLKLEMSDKYIIGTVRRLKAKQPTIQKTKQLKL